MDKGLRYNEGKTRHDLTPPFAQEQYARVLTRGAEKYAERNWERGMAWSKVLASLERHLQAVKRGEDFDQESGLLHSAHIMANAAFLTEYYRIYPQGDDRPHQYLSMPLIALDIDEVLADWTGHWATYFNTDPSPIFWNFDKTIKEKFEDMKDNKEFWLTIPRKVDPADLVFEPHCYITARPVDESVTREWLLKNGFPDVPIHAVNVYESKMEAFLASGADVLIDDRYENFVEINAGGGCCFLYDAPHNRKYEVGFKRIYHPNDVINGKQI